MRVSMWGSGGSELGGGWEEGEAEGGAQKG
jgi:hypothetical protein